MNVDSTALRHDVVRSMQCIPRILDTCVCIICRLPDVASSPCTGRGMRMFYTNMTPIEVYIVPRDVTGDVLKYVRPEDVECSASFVRGTNMHFPLRLDVRVCIDAQHTIAIAYAPFVTNMEVTELLLRVAVCGVCLVNGVHVMATFSGANGCSAVHARLRLYKHPKWEHAFSIAVNASDTRLVLIQNRHADTNPFSSDAPVFFVYELPSCIRLFAFEDAEARSFPVHACFASETELLVVDPDRVSLKRWSMHGELMCCRNLPTRRPNVVAARGDTAVVGCVDGVAVYTMDTDTVTHAPAPNNPAALQNIDALCFVNPAMLLAWSRPKYDGHGTLCTCTLDGTLLRRLPVHIVWCTSLIACADGTLLALAAARELSRTRAYAVVIDAEADADVLVDMPINTINNVREAMSIAASNARLYVLELMCKAGVYMAVFK